MFLRKLTVMVAPLLMALALCVLLPVMNGMGFWSNVLKGLILGVGLALLLPLSGASRKKEPFAELLWIPALLIMLAVCYQHLFSMGKVSIPMLNMLATTDGQVVLVECVLVGYMATQSIRTRK